MSKSEIRTGCDTGSEQKIFSNAYECPNCGSTDIVSFTKDGITYFKCNCCGSIKKNNLL